MSEYIWIWLGIIAVHVAAIGCAIARAAGESQGRDREGREPVRPAIAAVVVPEPPVRAA
jgi:hypothetical protein